MKKVVVLTAVLMFAGMSFGALTMTQWAANPVQNVGDLTFTLQSYTIADSVTADFWDYGGVFGRGVTFANFPTDGDVKYTVAINQNVAPGWEFDSVSLSSDSGATVATKYIEEIDQTIVDFGTIDLGSNGYSSLTITDTFDGVVPSASNSYVTVIPEPATLALLGLGGLLLRKRK